MTVEIIPKEIIRSQELGVFEETATLKTVLMWGEPGTEAALAQLLPPEKSCFCSNFDIPTAKEEFQRAQALLENSGVHIIRIKDLFAQTLASQVPQQKIQLNDLKSKLHRRAELLYKTYKQEISLPKIIEWIDLSLELDVEKYGEQVAVQMNNILSNRKLPMGNIMYARDQSNMLGNILILSSMRHPIRQPEVEIYKQSLELAGITNAVQVTGDGRFEGGDGIMHNEIAYIGVGGRTNMEGIRQIAPYLLTQGSRVIISYSQKRDQGGNEMDAMHLDTFWMPISQSEAVACPDEMSERVALEIFVDLKTKHLGALYLGKFENHITESGMYTIPVSKGEQKQHATNFLNLGDGSIMLTLPGTSELRRTISSKGIKIKDANLVELTKGYGGLHCMTAAIKRG